MKNLNRIHGALEEFYLSPVAHGMTFYEWLQITYGIYYNLYSSESDCVITVVNPELYTWFLLKWP